ncbi:MAG: hypothetical protein IRZ19_13930 [Pyrinomonas methylaliphatogenes]|nr:hypothetical protein [Pyrinomonas methylaliphatogenes]
MRRANLAAERSKARQARLQTARARGYGYAAQLLFGGGALHAHDERELVCCTSSPF